MKTKIGLTALILMAGAVLGLAQTSTNAPAPPANSGTFLDSVTGYFTTMNQDLAGTWTNKGTFWTAVDSIQGGVQPLANEIGLSYNLVGPISAEGVFRNSGVAGTILDYQGGFGLSFNVVDVRLTAYADAGYGSAEINDKTYGEIGVRVEKALTTHTFAGVGIAGQLPANRQIFSAFVGFTF